MSFSDNEEVSNSNNMIESDEDNFSTKKTKKCRIIDSDESNDENEKVNENESNSESEKSSDETRKKKKKKIKRTLLNSSDEEGKSSDDEPTSKKSPKPSHGSGSDAGSNSGSEKSNASPKVKKGGKINRSALLDSSDLEEESDTEVRPREPVLSSADESGSCSRRSNSEDEGVPSDVIKPGKKSKIENRQSRKSKSNAMKEIYSEAQRMLRESTVGLPYHKPRQRTLDEFLNRKKGTPELISDLKKLPKVGGNIEDVLKVEKILEEREKMREDFFKNEQEIILKDVPEQTSEEKDTLMDSNLKEASISDDLSSNKANDCIAVDGTEKAEEAMEADKEQNTEQIQQTQNCETQGGVDRNISVEENSLRLFLEPDTETLDLDDDIIQSSQNSPIDTKINEKIPTVLSKRLAALESRFDLTLLQETLSKKPQLGCHGGSKIFLGDDFEIGQEETGLETLKNRFVKHVRAKKDRESSPKTPEIISVVRKEVGPDGSMRLTEEKIAYGGNEIENDRKNMLDFEEVKRAQKTDKPGAQQVALKLTLRQQIMEDKKRERAERESKRRAENEEGSGDDEQVEEEEEILEDEELEEEELEEEEEELEDEEENEELEVSQSQRKSRIKCAFLDDEAEDEDCINEVESDDVINKDRPASPLFGFPTQDRESSFSLMTCDSGWTPLGDRKTQRDSLDTSTQGARKKLGFDGLFDQTDPNPENFDDVIGLCSGQFVTQANAGFSQENLSQEGLSQDSNPTPVSTMPEQTPDTVVLTSNLTQILSVPKEDDILVGEQDTEPLLADDNPVAEERALGLMEEYPGFLDSSDSDDEKVSTEPKPKKGLHKIKKNRVIVISDDDESDIDDQVNNDDDENDSVADEERAVLYDSEENEVDEEMPPPAKRLVGKNGRLLAEYLEREAELSGSEAGSDDEDESGLDRLMVEDGDLDDIDEENVRDEIGRIHQRQLLDEDQREIRLFQEAFLEDGELHSDNGRTRKFKWKDLDEADGDFENRLTQSGDEGEGEESKEDEAWRVQRLEREKWMEESESKGVESVSTSHDDSQFFNLATKVLKKIESKPKPKREDIASKSKIFKSPKANAAPLRTLASNPRGSFLSRDNSTLEKLAEMTKNSSSTKSGSGAKSSKNFAFAILSPPKQDIASSEPAEKRKKCSKNMSEQPLKKRPKIDRSINENSNDTIFASFN